MVQNSDTFSRYPVILIALAMLGMSGCAVYDRPYHPSYVHPIPSPGVTYYDYWYYPGVQVYFDINRRVYFYYSSTGWVQVRVLPPALRARLGTHVPLRSRYTRPYVEHNEHYRRYPPQHREEQRPPDRRDKHYTPPSRYVPTPHDYNGRPREEPPRAYEREPRYSDPNAIRAITPNPKLSQPKQPVRRDAHESPRKPPTAREHERTSTRQSNTHRKEKQVQTKAKSKKSVKSKKRGQDETQEGEQNESEQRDRRRER
jgi:hypothetical protein